LPFLITHHASLITSRLLVFSYSSDPGMKLFSV
jgi:hypothetical protein